MWFLGHLGIGSKLAAPFSRKLPYGWLLFGTLLPDLIDKPLYYAAAAITGRQGLEIGLISCTRTFGHTSLFLFALAFAAAARNSKALAALTLGVATHLMLDGFQDYWTIDVTRSSVSGVSSLRLAALWPFLSDRFGDFPYRNPAEHLRDSFRSITAVCEIVGAAILGWDYWKGGKRFKPPRWLRRRARI